MNTLPSRWSVENVERIQAFLLSSKPAASPEPRDERYYATAAVVTRFAIDPQHHRHTRAAGNLLNDSMLVEEVAGRQYWSLKNEVRKRVLARLRTREELARALAAAPEHPDDLVQNVFESWIAGKPAALDEQTPEELSATLQVIDWLETTELESALPDTDDVLRRVEHANLLQPFRDLVGEHFKGRARELDILRDYLYGTDRDGQMRPLLIYGPGGMGKTTLISKFILNAIATEPPPAIIYLDSDRPGLVAEEPLTLLAEAVYQLGLQFKFLYESAARLRKSWLAELAEFRAGASNTLESVSLEAMATRDRRDYIDSFALFAREVPGTAPVLLVIDTFEELQYRSREFVDELFDFLRELHASLPRLRVVISGRDEVISADTERLPLSELDVEAAEGYLDARGVEPLELRRGLARALHGNPLSLTLAATLLTVGTVSQAELSDLEQIADDAQIQGILYRRILGHLHDRDEELERIAHPGLILRRITPDLIRYAIAGPCGLSVDSDQRAQDLFNRLQNELSLVIREGDAVRHRPDVRRVMLPALRAAERERTDAIQHAAIEYYQDFDDAASRAEEIYHRLLLGDAPDVIDARWSVPGIEDFLRGATEDLSGRSAAYLAARLGLEVYDQDLESLENLVWERTVANRVESLIRLDRPQDALRLMRTRAWRSPGSALYWLEARLLRQLGRNRESRQVGRTGIASLNERTIGREHLDLFILTAESDEALGTKIDWDAVVVHNRQLLAATGDEPRRVRFALAYLRLAARTGVTAPAVTELTTEAIGVLHRLSRRELARLAQELPALSEFDHFRMMHAPRPAPKQRTTYAVEAADQSQVADALMEACPTIADLAIVVGRLHARLDDITTPSTVTVAAAYVVKWAESQGRTGELLSTAAAFNPKALRLHTLLASHGTRIDPSEEDPFDVVLLPGGRPFLGRAELRHFMRDLLTPSPGYRMLSIVGPPGSGKSYTREYLAHVAAATGAFEVGYFNVSLAWSLEDIVRSIHSTFDRRWEASANPNVSITQQIGQYVNQVIYMGRRTRRVTVLFFDLGDEPIQETTRTFIQTLGERISTLAVPMAVIVSDYREMNSDQFRVERLTPLSKADIKAGFQRLGLGADGTLIQSAIDEISAQASSDLPRHNTAVNRLAASMAASFIDAGAPARVFISYAYQDADLLKEVVAQLDPLRAQGLIEIWSDRDIQAGADWRNEIARAAASAEIVLLFVSEAYQRLKHADSLLPHLTDRQQRGEVLVLPVRLSPDANPGALGSVQMVEPSKMVETVREAALDIRARRRRRTKGHLI